MASVLLVVKVKIHVKEIIFLYRDNYLKPFLLFIDYRKWIVMVFKLISNRMALNPFDHALSNLRPIGRFFFLKIDWQMLSSRSSFGLGALTWRGQQQQTNRKLPHSVHSWLWLVTSNHGAHPLTYPSSWLIESTDVWCSLSLIIDLLIQRTAFGWPSNVQNYHIKKVPASENLVFIYLNERFHVLLGGRS